MTKRTEIPKPKDWQALTKRFGGYWLRKCQVCGRTDFDNEDEHYLVGGAWGGPHGEIVHATKGMKLGSKYCGLVDEYWVGRQNC